PRLSVIVRSRLDVESVATMIRDAVRAEDPGQPVTDVQTLTALARQSTAYRRFGSGILTMAGLIAGLLAAFGILAVVLYHVPARRRQRRPDACRPARGVDSGLVRGTGRSDDCAARGLIAQISFSRRRPGRNGDDAICPSNSRPHRPGMGVLQSGQVPAAVTR